MSQYPPQPPYSQPSYPPPQPPYPPQALPYGYGYTAPNARPTSVIVMSIIGIIFAAMRILCTPLGLVPFFTPMPPNPVIDTFRNDPMLLAFLVIAGVLTCGLGVVLLIGCIGSLLLKRWARKLLVGYAIAQIAVEVISAVIQLAVAMPKVSAALGSGPQASQAIGGMIGGTVGGLVALVIPILLLFFMTRPDVIAAFESAASR